MDAGADICNVTSIFTKRDMEVLKAILCTVRDKPSQLDEAMDCVEGNGANNASVFPISYRANNY
jgi:hypothetical protein